MLRRFAFLAPLLAGLSFAGQLRAQTVYVSKPNCHVLAPHTDNPFDYRHYYTQPALAWDAEYALVSLSAGVLLRQLHAPLWVAGALPTIGFGLVPHLIGYSKGMYRIDVLHWAQSLVDRSTPAFWAYETSKDTTHYRKATLTWLALETPLSCWDR